MQLVHFSLTQRNRQATKIQSKPGWSLWRERERERERDKERKKERKKGAGRLGQQKEKGVKPT